MISIVGNVDTGKTRKLLEFASENNSVVICAHPAAMERKAKDYGIYGLSFISYLDYNIISGNCVIDELEEFLKSNFPNLEIYGYTETKN